MFDCEVYKECDVVFRVECQFDWLCDPPRGVVEHSSGCFWPDLGGEALGSIFYPWPFLSGTVPCSTSWPLWTERLCSATPFHHSVSALGSASHGLNHPETRCQIKPLFLQVVGVIRYYVSVKRQLTNTENFKKISNRKIHGKFPKYLEIEPQF